MINKKRQSLIRPTLYQTNLFAFFLLLLPLTLLFRAKCNAVKLPDTFKVKATQDGGLVLAYALDKGNVFLFVHLRPRLVIENAVACIRRREIKQVVQRRKKIVNLGNEGDKVVKGYK